MNTDEPDDALERLLDRTLRELPMRRAPATLESRVLGELERRAALPWWRRGFEHWPMLARAVFLVMCGALIRLAFLGGTTAAATVRSLSWSPTWLYMGIAACALLYVVLFGLGAAVYRTLYLQPQNGG